MGYPERSSSSGANIGKDARHPERSEGSSDAREMSLYVLNLSYIGASATPYRVGGCMLDKPASLRSLHTSLYATV
jgi:hypothetical protein